MDPIQKPAETFIYRHARPLDLTRWRYHFEGGSREDVLRALAYYQNEDGGFAHGLEADSWNPNSTPIQTWCATEILREINWTDSSHPIVSGILTYLSGMSDFENGHWLNTPLSNNDYPGAIWWRRDPEEEEALTYNPTAALVGFILCHTKPADKIYSTALELVGAAIDHFIGENVNPEMHICSCYIRLYEDLETLEDPPAFPMDAFSRKLRQTIASCLISDPANWASTYACKPSQFFRTPDDFGAKDYQELIQAEIDFLVKTQAKDGSWPVNWIWHSDYPREECLSLNWWKADIIIKEMCFVRNFS